MVKVKATKASKTFKKALKEFHRMVEEGEIFEVTEERYKFLHGDNPYNIIFVEPVDAKLGTQTKKVKIQPVEEPEIFIIEPGEEPVKVDDNLQPIKPKKKRTTKKKCE